MARRRVRWSWSHICGWAATVVLALLVGVEVVHAFVDAIRRGGSTPRPASPAQQATAAAAEQLPLALQTKATRSSAEKASAPVPPAPAPPPPPAPPAPKVPPAPAPPAPVRKRWRDDYKCGGSAPMEDGTPAECNPDHHPCCSMNGWCGSSEDHCECTGCVDYRPGASTAVKAKGPELSGRRCPAVARGPGALLGGYTTVFKELCCMGFDSGDGWGDKKMTECCKGLPVDFRDEINSLMAPFVEFPPPAPLQVTKRPRPLVADCSNAQPAGLRQYLTGRPRSEPAKLIDVTFLANELDLLEARLFELDADYVVVAEASHNFRGDKKGLHFQASQARFAHFLPRVLHVNVDACPEYKRVVESLRQHNVIQGNIWPVQDAQRLCIWKMALPQLRRLGLPPDALVYFSDIDEIPSGQFIHTLRHCEVKPEALPMQPSLQNLAGNLRARCPSQYGSKERGQIVPWKEVDFDGCINRYTECRLNRTYPRNRVDGAGAHYSSFGSIVMLDYKSFNHAEGGNFAPVVVDSLGYCDVTEQTLVKRQQLLQDNPRLLVRWWEHRGDILQKGPIKREELEACDVAWIFIENPERYPFIYGAAEESITRHMLGLSDR